KFPLPVDDQIASMCEARRAAVGEGVRKTPGLTSEAEVGAGHSRALETRPGHKPGTFGTTRLLFSESGSRRRGCPQAKGRAAERRPGRLREHEAETMTTARTRIAWAGCAPGGYGLCGPSASTGRPCP